MIYSRFKIYKPNYIIFVFDYDRNNFRNKIYPYYKSNRKKIPSNLVKYILFIKRKLILWNIKILSIPNVEGDDVIASFINKIKKTNKNKYIFYILSYDKDFLQLVNKNIYLIISSKIYFSVKKFFNKYKIYPSLIKDLLALCGDKSDNIPGIKGIGIKTALILLNKIGNIKKIYKNLNKIKKLKIKNKSKIIKNLKENYKNILIWYKLIKFKKNINLKINLNKFLINNFLFNKIFYKINKLINFNI